MRRATRGGANPWPGKTEERYRALIENLPYGVIVSCDGEIVFANKAAARIAGAATPDVLIGTRLADRIAPESRDVVVRRISSVLDGESATIIEEKGLRVDGEVVDIETTATPTTYQGVPAVLSIFRDVSDRKQAEEALRASEQRNRALLESDVKGIVAVDESGCITFVNPQMTRMFGYTTSELLGERVELLVPEEARRPHRSHSAGFIRSPSTRPMGRGRELYARRKDGSTFPVEIALSEIEDGGESKVMANITDITERKRAQDAIERQAERLRAIREIDKAILSAESPSSLAAAAVRRLRALLGLRRVSVVLFDTEARTASLLAQSSARSIKVRKWKGTWDQGFEDQIESLRKGHEFSVEDIRSRRRLFDVYEALYQAGLRSHTALPLMSQGQLFGALYIWSDKTGKLPEEAVAVCREVADQLAIALQQAQFIERIKQDSEELEQRVEERTAQLAKSNRELDAFAYSISHDLRAPLRAMQGFGQALLEDYGGRLDPVADDFIQRIVEASGQMDALIQGLLQYARIVRQSVVREPVSLSKASQEAIALVQGSIIARGANVAVAVDDLEVIGQHHTVVQVLANLVSNAVKFVPDDRKPRVRVRASTRGPRVRTTVTDNGIGIRDDYQERIFGMFERLHNTDEFTGTGIGLAIVSKGVERMGGRLGVESTPGKGSRFWFELPREQG